MGNSMKLYKPQHHKPMSGKGYEGGEPWSTTPSNSPYEQSYLNIEQFPGKRFWTFGLFASLEGVDDNVLAELRSDGWEPWNDATRELFLLLESQFAQTLIVQEYEYGFRYWARSADISFAQRYPVLLTYQTEEEEYPRLLPPDMIIGTHALVPENDIHYLYTVEQLGEQGQHICTQIKAGMLLFPDDADPSERDRRTREAERKAAWDATHDAAQQLAKLYWQLHQEEQVRSVSARAHGLPALTSAHRTRLPLTNSFRGLAQSFGPAVQPSIWNQEREGTLQLVTPNGSTLRVEGTNACESVALHRYVTEMLGPEGLKHLLILLDAYYLQTNGTDRKSDARVSLRQLLIRLGAGSKADDREEQQKLMHTILYLASTYISSDERPVEEAKPLPLARQRKRKKVDRKDYSPLLVIERLKPGPDGSIQIPDEVEYHLGFEFFETLFGPQQQFFTVPTALLLRYHAVRQQQELLLAFYLSNALITSGGQLSVSFPALILQSALESQETLEHGHDRLRDAQRVLFALEHLEKHEFIRRDSHIAIDAALTVELATAKYTQDDVSPNTYLRIKQGVAYQRQLSPAELRSKRRIAYQQLLDERMHLPVRFTAGSLLEHQVAEHIARQRLAQEQAKKQEQAKIAPVIVDAAPSGTEGQAPKQRRSRKKEAKNAK